MCACLHVCGVCAHEQSHFGKCIGEAITTELIRYGLGVGVVVLPANHMLKTEQALKVVGPKAFGFDLPYQEPRPFPLK